MQLNKYSTKKIKTINSLDTQITQSEILDSHIKISLKSPRKIKQQQQKTERTRVQIIGIPQQDQMVRSSRQTYKNLLKVPQIVLKKQNSLFDTHNFEAMLKSTNQEQMKMMIRNTDVRQGSVSREMNQNSLLMTINSAIRQSNNKPYEQQRPTQKLKKLKEQPRNQDNIKKQTLQDIFLSNQDHKKKLLNNKGDITNMNQKQQQVGNQQLLSQRKTTKGYNIVIKEPIQSPIKELQLKDTEKKVNKESLKITKTQSSILQKKPKESRLKLSDYLFKTQVSSTKALQQKKQRIKERKQKQAVQRKVSEKPIKQPISKYGMPNHEFGQILRAQINSDLDSGINYLKTLKDLINKTQLKPGTTTGELVQVFRVRKIIQDQVNKQLEKLVQQFATFQVSSKQKTTNLHKQKEDVILI